MKTQSRACLLLIISSCILTMNASQTLHKKRSRSWGRPFHSTKSLHLQCLEKHKDSPFICTQSKCKKAFNSYLSLKEHVMKGHNTSITKIAQYLMIDSRITGDNSDLICPDCDAPFNRKWRGNLMRHMRTWHNIKPFSCMEAHCLKSFETGQELTEHTTKKHGEKKHEMRLPVNKISENNIDHFMFDDSDLAPQDVTPENQPLKTESLTQSPTEFDTPAMNINAELHISDLHQLDLVNNQQLEIDEQQIEIIQPFSNKRPKIWLHENT